MMTDQATQQADNPSPRRWKRWVFFWSVALTFLVWDQWSKHWALQDLRTIRGGSQSLLQSGKLTANFTFVKNPGAAWGLLSNADESFRGPFFFVVSVCAMVFILFLFWRLPPGQRLLTTALPFILGGAAGNFVDRLRFQFVVDFIDLRYGTLRWPTFNVADVAITLGVMLLFADMLAATYRQWAQRE